MADISSPISAVRFGSAHATTHIAPCSQVQLLASQPDHIVPRFGVHSAPRTLSIRPLSGRDINFEGHLKPGESVTMVLGAHEFRVFAKSDDASGVAVARVSALALQKLSGGRPYFFLDDPNADDGILTFSALASPKLALNACIEQAIHR